MVVQRLTHNHPTNPVEQYFDRLGDEHEGRTPPSQLGTLGEVREQSKATNPDSPQAKDQDQDSSRRVGRGLSREEFLGQFPAVRERLERSFGEVTEAKGQGAWHKPKESREPTD